mmetsp:Transcript_9935/g.17902  ORF Transcript_9935/g.17902 Transcript_9935/m.17902 type:complete len:89 (-) Transcript_9935:20-286(-)
MLHSSIVLHVHYIITSSIMDNVSTPAQSISKPQYFIRDQTSPELRTLKCYITIESHSELQQLHQLTKCERDIYHPSLISETNKALDPN